MRIAFFGSRGPLTEKPLCALEREHEVVAFVRAAPARTGVRSLLRGVARKLGAGTPDPFETWAGEHGSELLWSRGRRDARLLARLERLELDLICISGFRWILDAELFELPRLGSLNVHAALLPRHRGANPFFWLYHANDREAGVTLHRVERGVDTGAILAQAAFELPRGQSVDRTGARCAELGAELLTTGLQRLEAGDLVGTAQEEARATQAPVVAHGSAAVDFEHWDAERVWHFLAGLYPRFLEPLRADDGEIVRYGGVAGFERADSRHTPGTVRRSAGGWELQALDGVVHLLAAVPHSGRPGAASR